MQKARNDLRLQRGYFKMYLDLAKELEDATSMFSRPKCVCKRAQVFHICMAPGGYAIAIQRMQKRLDTFGITLPESEGGHKLLMQKSKRQPMTSVELDVTMLGDEFGLDWNAVSATNAFINRLVTSRPFEKNRFDIVVCDGNIVNEDKVNWSMEKYARETMRLEYSQLILAMQRIKPKGTIAMLMRNVEDIRTIYMLHDLVKFSLVQTFKPVSHHQNRGTFYMVAKEVDPVHPAAIEALRRWKREWAAVTVPESIPGTPQCLITKPAEMQKIITNFGDRLLKLGAQPWSVQLAGIESIMAKYGKASLSCEDNGEIKDSNHEEKHVFRVWKGANNTSRALIEDDFVFGAKKKPSKRPSFRRL